jgi:hypothetical protein
MKLGIICFAVSGFLFLIYQYPEKQNLNPIPIKRAMKYQIQTLKNQVNPVLKNNPIQ